jgi:hypothetical protein
MTIQLKPSPPIQSFNPTLQSNHQILQYSPKISKQPKMATNYFKITKDTSARKNTRVGSIQSAVEAAALRESHEYYITRLTENHKQQVETMEQGCDEQIR